MSRMTRRAPGRWGASRVETGAARSSVRAACVRVRAGAWGACGCPRGLSLCDCEDDREGFWTAHWLPDGGMENSRHRSHVPGVMPWGGTGEIPW